MQNEAFDPRFGACGGWWSAHVQTVGNLGTTPRGPRAPLETGRWDQDREEDNRDGASCGWRQQCTKSLARGSPGLRDAETRRSASATPPLLQGAQGARGRPSPPGAAGLTQDRDSVHSTPKTRPSREPPRRRSGSQSRGRRLGPGHPRQVAPGPPSPAAPRSGPQVGPAPAKLRARSFSRAPGTAARVSLGLVRHGPAGGVVPPLRVAAARRLPPRRSPGKSPGPASGSLQVDSESERPRARRSPQHTHTHLAELQRHTHVRAFRGAAMRGSALGEWCPGAGTVQTSIVASAR